MNKTVASIIGVGLSFYCACASARYIQADPLGLFPALPIAPVLPASRPINASDVLNLHQLNHSYAYVRSNPLRYTDPLGLEPVGTIPADPNQAAVFYNFPRGMRKATGGCVVDCLLKRQISCLPMRAAGVLGGLGVAAAGSFASGGADFPVLAPPAVVIGGNTGGAICTTYFFEKSCAEECRENSCKPE